MKIVDFKSVSPLYEMERNGEKPFTTRKIDYRDKRFRVLSQWIPGDSWGIRITNPATGESFVRELIAKDRLRYFNSRQKDWKNRLTLLEGWVIIVMGDRLK